MEKFLTIWAALGFTLSTATQLRPEGLPIGPSELILTAWMLFVVFLLLRGVRVTTGPVFVGVTGYWLVALLLLVLGTMVAIYTREFDPSVALHDGFAFVYASVASSLIALSFYDRGANEYHLYLARAAFLFHSFAAALLLGVAYVVPAIGPMDFWYAGLRFSGWAKNPNQMALAMVAMPFLGWYLLQRSSTLAGRSVYLLGIGVCLAAGIATKSDALRVATVAGAGAVAALLFYRVTLRGRSRWLHVSHAILPAVAVIVGVFYGHQLLQHIGDTMDEIYSEGAQGAKRFTLWYYGLGAIAQSPLVGFGPGPFSGLTAPLQGEEAHNSLIDWGMSTGGAGILLHLTLLGWCLQRAVRSRYAALVGAVTALAMFSLFGYSLRHPDYWLVIVLVLSLARQEPRPVPRQSSPLAVRGGPVPPFQTQRSIPRLQQPRAR